MEKRQIYLVIGSAFVCIGAILLYKELFNNTTELDIVSHFFGGLSVYISITIVFPMLDEKTQLIILLMCVIGFEIAEYITSQYPYDSFSNINSMESKFDALTDIVSGLVGGYLYSYRRKNGIKKTRT